MSNLLASSPKSLRTHPPQQVQLANITTLWVRISKAISEIYRILRQDGVYLGFDWFGEKESNLHYGEPVSGDLGSSFTKFSEGDFHNVEYISPVNPEVVQRYFNEFRTIKYNREILLDSQEEIIKDKYHLECAK